MYRFLCALAVTGVVTLPASFATANDGYYPQRQPAIQHGRHHDDLGHRTYHRGLEHQQAHRYPMTWSQHGGLHAGLRHEAYHDGLEHRGAHRSGAYRQGSIGPNRYAYGNRYAPQGGSGYYGGGGSYRHGR